MLRHTIAENFQKQKHMFGTWGLVAISLLIGTCAGYFAILFRLMIGWSHTGFYSLGENLFSFVGDWWPLFVPALAGLFVGPLIHFFAREAKGHGVPEVMEAVALKGGRMRMRVIFVKALASASSIGAGASVGREGPIIQMGSGIGSVIARFFKLHEEKTKTCVACGAAAGIAATFNAPIAGVIFSQEVILGKFNPAVFVPVVISSVTASVISRIYAGDIPAFSIEPHALTNPMELFLYAILGIIAAFFAVIFTKFLYKTEDIFDLWTGFPSWLKPVVGGLIIGFIGLHFPQILGVGYETIEGTFQGQFVLSTLLILIVLKILATSITLGSGHSGGVFAPSLFIGSTLGGAFGLVAHHLFPGLVQYPAAYAIVGMGAVVAGTTQAPITAVLIIFEMTRDYRLILPLMLCVVISTLVFSLLSNGSIYTLKLLRRGVNLESGRDINLMKSVMVKDVLSYPVQNVVDNHKIETVISMMHDTKHNGFPVTNVQDELVGIVTLQDIRDLPVPGIMHLPVTKVMSKRLIVCTPEETLDDVFLKLNKYDIGHLPVVSPDNPKKLVGIITRSDVIKAYDQRILSHY